MESETSKYRDLFREVPVFRWVWLSRGLSSAGDAVQLVAIYWLVTRPPNPGLGAAVIAFAITIPPAFAGPFIGVLVDRVQNRRKFLIGADLLRVILTLAIPFAYEMAGLYAAAAIAFAQALVGAGFGAGFSAALPEIVGARRLGLANGLTLSTSYAVMAAGAGIGGVLTEGNVYIPFVANAGTFLASAVLIVIVPRRFFEVERADSSSVGTYMATLVDGWRYTRSDRRLLLYLLIAVLATVGFAPAPVALIVLSKEVLGAGPGGYGLLMMMTTAGLAAGAALGGRLAAKRNQATLLGVGDSAMGIATLGLGLAFSLPIAAGWVVLRSASNALSSVPGITLLQRIVPSEYRGRAFTLVGVISEIPRAAILPIAGLAIEALGVRQVYFLMSGFILAAGLLALLLRHQLDPLPEEIPTQEEKQRDDVP